MKRLLTHKLSTYLLLLHQAASDDEFFNLNSLKSKNDTNIEIDSAQLFVQNPKQPEPIRKSD
jgi:hypothetical protein